MEPYKAFQKKLGISFNDINVLQQAFIHRSYINENKDSGFEHNERLEFLGDAVLELVVTDFLYQKYQDVDEGVLTAYRSSLVRTESISQAARDLGMNELLLLSKGESRDEGKARNYILANTFEALIGAIYLDLGYQSAHDVIAASLFDNITQVIADGSWKDAKSRFQEYAQEQYGHTPEYILETAKGPDHDKLFTIAVVVGDKKMAVGKGRSKQKAQQNAAAKALESVCHDNHDMEK